MPKLPLILLFAAVGAFARPGPSFAQQAVQPAPRSIGKWGDWEAFTSRGADATVCHALSRPFSSVPAAAGQGDPTLTATRWPGRRDAVALASGRAGVDTAEVELRVGSALFPFEAGPDGAPARDGAAVVAAMRRGLQAVAHFVAPDGARTTDTYSLRDFRAAYGAMRRACPTRSPRRG